MKNVIDYNTLFFFSYSGRKKNRFLITSSSWAPPVYKNVYAYMTLYVDVCKSVALCFPSLLKALSLRWKAARDFFCLSKEKMPYSVRKCIIEAWKKIKKRKGGMDVGGGSWLWWNVHGIIAQRQPFCVGTGTEGDVCWCRITYPFSDIYVNVLMYFNETWSCHYFQLVYKRKYNTYWLTNFTSYLKLLIWSPN